MAARSTPRRRAEPTRPWSRRQRRTSTPGARSAAVTPASPEPAVEPDPPAAPRAEPPPTTTPTTTPTTATPADPPDAGSTAAPAATAPPPPRSLVGHRLLTALWVLGTLAGVALLVVGLFDPADWGELVVGGFVVDVSAAWVAEAGAVAVATTYVWALAARTGGRPAVFGLLTLAVGVVAIATDLDPVRNGAAVMVCVVSAVLAVVATVPAVGLRHALREVVVAMSVAAAGGLATAGLAPDVEQLRFEYVTLGLALVGAFGLIWRLGAGLHGLGRRGMFIVVVGALVLGVTLAYAELLRRYGTPGLVALALDGVGWLEETIGAAPRPIMALLGVPALVWGTHMRARRRQGWWVCAFGVGATAPVTQALLVPTDSRTEMLLSLGYGLVLGLLVGALLVLADLAVTGNRGRRGRRAETAAAVRPEPSRIEALL